MTLGDLRSIIREVLEELNEANVTNVGGASHGGGAGAQYATPYAFSKGRDNRAVQYLKRIGFKKVERPKRPSHTKGFDYL
tara:strand:- start:14288 stop:14527 length:240 start_codon:yes stop_codon:yes gene_type:complete